MEVRRKAVNTILAKVNRLLRKYLYLDEDFCVMLKATDPEVLSQNDHDEIKALQNRCAKIDFLIDMMKRKPVDVFLAFMNVLKEKDSDLYPEVKIIQDEYLPTHAPDSVENPSAGEIVLPVAITQDVKCDNHPDRTTQYIYMYCNTCQKQVCCNNMILLHHKDCRIITQPMDVEQYSTIPVAATPEKKSDKHPHETLLYESSIALSNEPELSILSDVRCDIWKQTGQFSTTPALRKPHAITIHPDGDVAVTHVGVGKDKAAIFSKDGHLQDSFKIESGCDIAINLENKYIFFDNSNKILIYDQQGNPLEVLNIETSDAYNEPFIPMTLAVDSQGRIIVGLWDETISIHNADGSLISKFATPATPKKLDVTSKGDIVVLYHDEPMIQLMDYSGNNVRELKQPDEVNDWTPQAVCCSKQDEVFISSSDSVYRYTCTADDDQYHASIIISGLKYPQDITITADGQHLYVVEFMQSSVKIFQRPDNSAPKP